MLFVFVRSVLASSKISCVFSNRSVFVRERERSDCSIISLIKDKPIEPYIDEYGFERLRNWQARICGYDIMHIILAAEKYSGYDTTELRKQIEEKRVFYKDNHPDDYAREVGEDIDLFELWAKNGW